MQNEFMNSLPRLLGLLGLTLFCGILPLVFAAIAFFSARKRRGLGDTLKKAIPVPIAGLKAGGPLSCVSGQIKRLAPSASQALLRLKVEIWDSGGEDERPGWKGFTEKMTTSPFLLEDSSGQVWVNPQHLDKNVLGNGVSPTQDQLNEAIEILGIDPAMFQHGQFRYQLWELKPGQSVTVIGVPQQQQDALWLSWVKGQPMVVSALSYQQITTEVSQQTSKASVMTWVLGIPGILFLMIGCVMLATTLAKLLG